MVGAALAERRAHPGEALNPAVLHQALADAPDGGISVRYAVSQIVAEEDRLLVQRTAEANAARQRVKVTLAGATILDLVLLMVAFRLVVKFAEGRQQLAARSAESVR